MFSPMPIEGEKHYTASIVLLSEEQTPRVLLVHHQKLDVWMPPGGHEEALENPLETGAREVKEETGIDISPYLPQQRHLDERAVAIPLPQYFFEERIDPHGDQPPHVHLDFIYVVSIPYQEPLLEKTEHHAIRWFTKQELDTVSLFPNVRAILLEIL
jgi:8-oxo-dGTP pyrophosphatase MutT (NUDIX family)